MSSIPQIDCFDCEGDTTSVGIRWQKWKRALEIYFEAAGISEPGKKRATLLHCGGLALQEVFYSLPGANAVATEENDIYTIAVNKLENYFAPKQSKVYERHVFRLLKQEVGEKFEKFLVRLRHQAGKCAFSNKDEQLIDQITEKCTSTELRKKILAIGDAITLDEIISEANSLETIERQLIEFNTKQSSSTQEVNYVTARNNGSYPSPPKRCSRCGMQGNNTEDNQHKCPAKNAICKKCNFRGHFS